MATGFAVLLTAGALGACSAGTDTTLSTTAADSADPGSGGAEGGGAGEADDQAGPTTAPGANRTTVRTKALVKTGQLVLTSSRLDRTRAEVERLLTALGGGIDSEQASHDDEGRLEQSTLVLRVPADKFEAATEALEKLGKVKSSDTSSKNVTTEVIDVDERVQTLQNSLDRLQKFQRASGDIDDLVRFENEITQRESELRSLQAQQAYLADQTAMATITLHLSTPARYVAPPDALDGAGFLTGLRSGWNALKDVVVVALTVAGAVLPFTAASLLVGGPVLLLVRALLRRRARPTAPEEG